MRVCVIGLAALCACDSLSGLAHLPPLDASPDAVDGPPPDGACTMASIGAELDGPLDLPYPMQGNSQQTIINISDVQQRRGTFRFDIQSLPPNYVALELVITYDERDDACGGTCHACTGLESPGPFHVYAMRSDWVERDDPANQLGITWNCRSGTASPAACTTSWYLPGADKLQTTVATGDRSVDLGTFEHASATDAHFAITGANVAMVNTFIDSRAAGKLSFLVVAEPGGGGQFVVRTHEHTCDVGKPASELVATYCP